MKNEIVSTDIIMKGLKELETATTNVINSTSQLAKATNAILSKLAIHDDNFTTITTAISSIQGEMETNTKRLDQLELNEEITSKQEDMISTIAKRRVFEIIGDDDLDYQKYFRSFISKLYTNARKEAGLGSKINRTRKGDYQRVIDYIEAWTPKGGCAAFKEEIDNKAKAKRKAKELGYVA